MRRLLLGAALLLVACNSGNGDNNSARLEGTYQGTYAVGGESVPLTLTAAQAGNAVSGTYTLDGDHGTFAANVDGQSFSAVLSSRAAAFVCNSTGTYDDDEVSGITSCSDGSNGSFHVRRA